MPNTKYPLSDKIISFLERQGGWYEAINYDDGVVVELGRAMRIDSSVHTLHTVLRRMRWKSEIDMDMVGSRHWIIWLADRPQPPALAALLADGPTFCDASDLVSDLYALALTVQKRIQGAHDRRRVLAGYRTLLKSLSAQVGGFQANLLED